MMHKAAKFKSRHRCSLQHRLLWARSRHSLYQRTRAKHSRAGRCPVCGTNPTLGFRALLTQHPLASAACLLLQRGGYRHSGHSRPSISREPTPYFRRSRARQEWCGTKRTYAHAAIADAASVSGRGMACVAAQKFRTSGH